MRHLNTNPQNSSLLSGNNQMISSLEQQKKELEEKLRN